MKLLVALAVGATLVFMTGAQTDSAKNAFTPDAIPYGPAPAFVPPGALLAVLEGDPGAATGDYSIRLKMPDGHRIAPHWHPKRENVTVISGTFKVGMGDRFDESKMGDFPAGSFAYLDPDMHDLPVQGSSVLRQFRAALGQSRIGRSEVRRENGKGGNLLSQGLRRQIQQ